MLTQGRADELHTLVKHFVDKGTIDFPSLGQILQIEVRSEDGRESFLMDINRKGKIKVSKCSYQERYQVVEILVRLDIDGPTHDNPDGTAVPCPHIHLYRENFADKWAYPLAFGVFKDTTDLVQTLKEFLTYCSVRDIPLVQRVAL